jgi:YVTN family beta-propeller protein
MSRTKHRSRTEQPFRSNNNSRSKRLRPLAGLLAMGLAAPALAHSVPFPTYETGPLANGSYVVSSGQIITPPGTPSYPYGGVQVGLGIRVRAKAVALDPNPAHHTAAVLTMGATQSVEVFDTISGEVLQDYLPLNNTKNADPSGSYGGIAYSADGKYLFFSQDSSHLAIAKVLPMGFLTDYAHVDVPPNTSFIKCFSTSPLGAYGVPCGTLYTTSTSYPGGLAVAANGKSAYVLLNQNNTLTQIDLTKKPPTEGTQIRVGNAPNSIVIDGTTAYISNEGGRVATKADFQILSAGTPIVADKVNGSATTGTVSVVDLKNMKLVDTIPVGLHPTGMALFGGSLLVSDTYSDTISVIDTATNKVSRTIDLGLPIKVPGETTPAYGAAPTGIAVDASTGVAYVALYNANAIAVVDLSGGATQPVMGYIPVAYAPASVVLDPTNKELLVSNDKGIGTRLSFETDWGVTGYNTHQDNGTVSIVPLPTTSELASLTKQVYQNNHWDLARNIASSGGGSKSAKPVAIPAKIGDPSLIKHVFLIIRENRTYDQMLGDVKAANGDPSLAVFGDTAPAAPVPVSPNAHALVKRFPLLDNFYDPSRQSADGHNWIGEGMAPYADDIQSPDWVRSYPAGNSGDALAYITKGPLFAEVEAAGLSVKFFGEQAAIQTFPSLNNKEPSWSQFYADARKFETGKEKTLKYENATVVTSPIPSVGNYLVKNFPYFDLGIPDQFRVDVWVQNFDADVKAGTVPALTIMWIMCDHTGGPPVGPAEQADNDLAVGRIIDYVSHSKVWPTSAIFIEEDDAQDGVDHVDGHRSPGYIVSPYAVQNGPTDDHYYTQVNMDRTIEQILGLPPMDQFDLIASPMTTDFVKGTPPKPNFAPWSHVPNVIPLNEGVKTTASNEPQSPLERAWEKTKKEMFAGKLQKPDSEDAYTLNHLDWYEATGFKRPYPGETTVRPPSDFPNRFAGGNGDYDD